MSINLFFVLVLSLLIGMFGYFKPTLLMDETKKEVPKFELESFVVYEISAVGIDRFFEGSHGKRFEDRYEVSSAKFSNNSKDLFESISANEALYKDDIISLEGDVHYVREDGLQFRSDEGKYDTVHSLVSTRGSFVITQNSNRVNGTQLQLNTKSHTVSANAVSGSYQLD
ncbi:MAG: LPS export ABC transporter periplasmic protein LptC [Sulfuricurvum sp.]|nr:LPS export ABC transporter periplasmic protein LptC [Sulfuricurvum sp.]MDP3021766.1 LPS export ABC transporter periplasmic protein LptC [Sulfuricurvum sp.]